MAAQKEEGPVYIVLEVANLGVHVAKSLINLREPVDKNTNGKIPKKDCDWSKGVTSTIIIQIANVHYRELSFISTILNLLFQAISYQHVCFGL